MSRECKVYQKELRSLGYGLPLYEPNPAQYDHVRIGDVGIADRDGYFLRIFNCFAQADHELNARYGVPEDFEPLEDRCQLTKSSQALEPEVWYKSQHVHHIEGSANFSSTNPSVGLKVSFTASSQQVAAFCLKYSAERIDAIRLISFQKYMLKHFESWEQFIRNLDIQFELRDIILVTGHVLTANWATATSIHRESRGSFGITIGNIAATALGTFSRDSECTIDVPVRIGPKPYTPPQRYELLEGDAPVPGNDEPFKDQCLFLHGYRVAKRPIIPAKLRAAAGPGNLDTDRDEDTYPDVVPIDSCSDEEDLASEGIVDHNFAIDLIFNYTNAEVAMVNESDVCLLAKAIAGSTGQPVLQSHEELCATGLDINVEFDPQLQKTVGTFFLTEHITPLNQSNMVPVKYNGPKKKALLVAVKYQELHNKHPDEDPPFLLPGAKYGPPRIRELLIDRYGYAEKDIVTLMDDDKHVHPTNDAMIKAMEALVQDAQPGDHFVFFFSGHGSQIVNEDGTEEDGFDEVIWPVDVQYDPSKSETERATNYIKDDDLKKILVDNLPPNAHLTVLLDCCHSGTGADDSLDSQWSPTIPLVSSPVNSEPFELPRRLLGDKTRTNPERTSSLGAKLSQSRSSTVDSRSSVLKRKSRRTVLRRGRRRTGNMRMLYMTRDSRISVMLDGTTVAQIAEKLPVDTKIVPEKRIEGPTHATSWSAYSDDQLSLDSTHGGILTYTLVQILREGLPRTNREVLKELSERLSNLALEANPEFKEKTWALPHPEPCLGSLRPLDEILDEPFTF